MFKRLIAIGKSLRWELDIRLARRRKRRVRIAIARVMGVHDETPRKLAR